REELHRAQGIPHLVRQHGGHLAHRGETARAQRRRLEAPLTFEAGRQETVLLLELAAEPAHVLLEGAVLALEPGRGGGEGLEGGARRTGGGLARPVERQAPGAPRGGGQRQRHRVHGTAPIAVATRRASTSPLPPRSASACSPSSRSPRARAARIKPALASIFSVPLARASA